MQSQNLHKTINEALVNTQLLLSHRLCDIFYECGSAVHTLLCLIHSMIPISIQQTQIQLVTQNLALN
jgi:hypothetical protein